MLELILIMIIIILGYKLIMMNYSYNFRNYVMYVPNRVRRYGDWLRDRRYYPGYYLYNNGYYNKRGKGRKGRKRWRD